MPEHNAPIDPGSWPDDEGLKSGDVELPGGAPSEAKPGLLGKGAAALRRRIAKRWVLLRLRRKSRQIKQYMEDSVQLDVIQNSLGRKDDAAAEALRLHSQAAAELSEPYRQIYLLRKAHGLSHKDISARLGISVHAVEAHLLEAVEHCDRYVRERTTLQPRRPPHLDQRDRHLNVVGRESDKPGGNRCTDVNRARGEDLAHSDGRRRAADGG